MRRLFFSCALLPALVGLLGACRQENKPPAIGNKLSAPTGLLVLGNSTAPVLLVSNANFRLEYASGSVVAIDMSLVDENTRFNLVDDVALSDLPLPNFSGPIALSPDGKTALISNRYTDGDVGTANDRVFFVDITNPAALKLQQFPAGHTGTNGVVVVGMDPYGIVTLRLPPQGPGRPPRDVAFVANQTDGTISVLNLTAGTICDDLAPAPCEQDAVPPAYASRAVFADVGTASNIRFSGPGVTPLVTLNQHWTVTFVEGLGLCLAPA
ncbi:MAG TPA: hypothetical protein VMV18_00560, partial [bacterium]|nr:hypothetical protein [bacterium]